MLTPIKSEKVYKIIMKQIKDIVKSGELKRGDKLPSERELALRLNVSRTSVREAIKALETLGLVESKHGGGNYIKNDFEDILLEPLSIAFMLLGSNNSEILELRKVIEPEVASMAAKNITENEIKELENIIEKLSKTTDSKICASLDKEFHYVIAKASKNHLLSTIVFSVSSLIEEYIDESKMYEIDREKVINDHKIILEAIISHDSKKAFIESKNHLN
ncbi:MAG: FadR/GntR family transcriptional regulator [Clostridiales bacterium]|nr:FadR/GntR family transcriptional regulator [Clostridiales bacterium]MDY2730190.1 FadR/GntR family transcriptional regulator [Clostridium sp.]NLK24125.1 FadR family transcriptional regulator [Clostridiales bacterium]